MSADKQSHTPGPWRAFIRNGVVAVMKGRARKHCGPKEVIKWTGFDGSDFPQHAAMNAFLIAAAPDMLAALKELTAFCDVSSSGETEWERAVDKARAAIRKAEGASEAGKGE